MNAHGKDIKIFSCNSNRPLADAIAKDLGLSLGDASIGMFSDGEISCSIGESVRGSEVFVVQSTSSPAVLREKSLSYNREGLSLIFLTS